MAADQILPARRVTSASFGIGPPDIRAASGRIVLNLFGAGQDKGTSGVHEADMSDESKLRKWAAEAARQAEAEKDANEARRLLSFAQYWTRLADEEDLRRNDQAA